MFTHFLDCKGLPNDDVEVARGAGIQNILPGPGFQTVDFVKEKVGGATVVRLHRTICFVSALRLGVRLGSHL